MKIDKLASADAFLAIDLEDTTGGVGIVRVAKKILTGGAELLARSTTYSFASFEIQRGGVSGGVNAIGDDRDDAVAAAVGELAPRVAAGEFSIDPGKGVRLSEFAALSEADTRRDDVEALADQCRAATVAASAGMVPGGVEGRRVVLAGFDASGPATARRLSEAGATITGIATLVGAALRPDGFGADELAEAWAESGPGCAATLAGGEAEPEWKALVAPCEILVAGTKTGVVSHTTTVHDGLVALVPSGPVPYTTKALSTLARAGVIVMPDFLTTAGATLAWDADAAAGADEIETASVEAVVAALGEVIGGDDSPVLTACLRAEAFLSTWRDELPYGRPMA